MTAMGISVAHQTVVFLYSIVFGAAAAFLYDVFRVIRRRIRHLDLVVMAEDIIFWLAAFASLFVFVYNVNSGELRAFLMVGAAMGAFLYFACLSRPVSALLSAIFAVLEKIILFILRPFIKIIRFAAKKSKKSAKKTGNFLRKFKNLFKFRIKSAKIFLGVRKK
ncbi:MAG: spore cortex biosynthesis protein YabQ [Clostridia bacterium]|nr:spore cortex biosynthesis protein YabQ [Clostridia bacterium]